MRAPRQCESFTCSKFHEEKNRVGVCGFVYDKDRDLIRCSPVIIRSDLSDDLDWADRTRSSRNLPEEISTVVSSDHPQN